MHVLRKSLKACGYRGACESEPILTWAMRTGACSQFYNDLLAWLESHLRPITCSIQVRTNIMNLFAVLRTSVLMIPHPGTEMTSPKEFRLQTLKVLTHQLELSRKKEGLCVDDSPHKDQGTRNASLYGQHLRVTLNMEKRSNAGDWNERQVRYNPNLLEFCQ